MRLIKREQGGEKIPYDDSDSISVDSLDFDGIDEYQDLDEDGNHVQKPLEPTESEEASPQPTETPLGEANKNED